MYLFIYFKSEIWTASDIRTWHVTSSHTQEKMTFLKNCFSDQIPCYTLILFSRCQIIHQVTVRRTNTKEDHIFVTVLFQMPPSPVKCFKAQRFTPSRFRRADNLERLKVSCCLRTVTVPHFLQLSILSPVLMYSAGGLFAKLMAIPCWKRQKGNAPV